MYGISDKLVQFIKYAVGIAILILLLKAIEFLFSLELTISSEHIELQYGDVFNVILILLTFVIIILTVLIAVVAIAALVGWQWVERAVNESVARAAGAWMGMQTDEGKVRPEHKRGDNDVEDT